MLTTYESIQTFCEWIHMWIDLRKLWIDSLWYYSGKFDSIQKEWHKENGQKEC